MRVSLTERSLFKGYSKVSRQERSDRKPFIRLCRLLCRRADGVMHAASERAKSRRNKQSIKLPYCSENVGDVVVGFMALTVDSALKVRNGSPREGSRQYYVASPRGGLWWRIPCAIV